MSDMDEIFARLSIDDRRAVVEHMARINLALEQQQQMTETDRMIVESLIRVPKHPGGVARRQQP